MIKAFFKWMFVSLALPIFFLTGIVLFYCWGVTYTQTEVVPSPSHGATLNKIYFLDVDGRLTYALDLGIPGLLYPSATRLIFMDDIPEMGDVNDAIAGWEGDHHLTLGWAKRAPPRGPDHVGDINITYKQYEPDIDRLPGPAPLQLRLHDTVLRFKEIDGRFGAARYTETNEPVPNIKCIIEASGTDGEKFDGITVQIIADGEGQPEDPYPSVSGVGVRYFFLHPVKQKPVLTPTQAKLGALHLDSWTEVPQQGDFTLYYNHYTKESASAVFNMLKKGKLTLKVGLNFGQQILTYDADIHLTGDVIRQFNACTAKTNIYGHDVLRVD
jgi:hypothetical protein